MLFKLFCIFLVCVSIAADIPKIMKGNSDFWRAMNAALSELVGSGVWNDLYCEHIDDSARKNLGFVDYYEHCVDCDLANLNYPSRSLITSGSTLDRLITDSSFKIRVLSPIEEYASHATEFDYALLEALLQQVTKHYKASIVPQILKINEGTTPGETIQVWTEANSGSDTSKYYHALIGGLTVLPDRARTVSFMCQDLSGQYQFAPGNITKNNPWPLLETHLAAISTLSELTDWFAQETYLKVPTVCVQDQSSSMELMEAALEDAGLDLDVYRLVSDSPTRLLADIKEKRCAFCYADQFVMTSLQNQDTGNNLKDSLPPLDDNRSRLAIGIIRDQPDYMQGSNQLRLAFSHALSMWAQQDSAASPGKTNYQVAWETAFGTGPTSPPVPALPVVTGSAVSSNDLLRGGVLDTAVASGFLKMGRPSSLAGFATEDMTGFDDLVIIGVMDYLTSIYYRQIEADTIRLDGTQADRLANLNAGTVDVVISATSITQSRTDDYAFGGSYVVYPIAFVGVISEPRIDSLSISDLLPDCSSGTCSIADTFCVFTGTVGEEFVRSTFFEDFCGGYYAASLLPLEASNVVQVTTFDEGINALTSNTCNWLVEDEPVIAAYLNELALTAPATVAIANSTLPFLTQIAPAFTINDAELPVRPTDTFGRVFGIILLVISGLALLVSTILLIWMRKALEGFSVTVE